MRTITTHLKTNTFPSLLPWLGLIISLVTLEYIFRQFFDANKQVGHDFAGVMPLLLDGFYWFKNNGLMPEWFSPAFCAGIPSFSDPQHFYYSLLQFLAFIFNPLDAVHFGFLIYAALGYWGMYWYCSRCLSLNDSASLFAAVLWACNGFVAHHVIVGHINFIGVSLIPCIAVLSLNQSHNRWRRTLTIITIGLLTAGWLHSGLGSILIAALLSVTALIAIAILRGKHHWKTAIINLGAGGLIGLAISAAKIIAATSTMANFPRTHYPLPGIASVGDILLVNLASFTLPSQIAESIAAPRLANVMFYLGPQEWAFTLTPIPFLFMLLGLVIMGRQYLKAKSSAPRATPAHRFSTALTTSVLVIALLIPLLIQFYSPEWNTILKSTPIIKSLSTPFRWMALWIPVICIGGAIAMQYASPSKYIRLISWTAIGIFILIIANEPRDYYQNQGYDPKPVINAFEKAKAEPTPPAITLLGALVNENGEIVMPLNRNDTMTRGISQAYCYNPLFGYRLENLDLRNLSPGNLLKKLDDGNLNMKNPVCYTFPKENQCQPGDHFHTEQAALATKLTHYQPWDFERPLAQQIASMITMFTLLAVAIAGLISAVLSFKPSSPNSREP